MNEPIIKAPTCKASIHLIKSLGGVVGRHFKTVVAF